MKPEGDSRKAAELIDERRAGAIAAITAVSSANQKCALSSALFRRVEVPLALK